MVFRFRLRGFLLIAAPMELGETTGMVDVEVRGSGCCGSSVLTSGGLGIVTFFGLGLVVFPRFTFGCSSGDCGASPRLPALTPCFPGVSSDIECIIVGEN
jgi:hypothetical protein